MHVMTQMQSSGDGEGGTALSLLSIDNVALFLVFLRLPLGSLYLTCLIIFVSQGLTQLTASLVKEAIFSEVYYLVHFLGITLY